MRQAPPPDCSREISSTIPAQSRRRSFDLTGAGIPLEAIERIQTARLPIGGRLNLQLRGQGPLLAPELHATLRLVDLKFGDDVVGSF